MTKYIAGAVVGAAVVVSLVASPVLAKDKAKGPIKVFILAGQSNMEGQGGGHDDRGTTTAARAIWSGRWKIRRAPTR